MIILCLRPKPKQNKVEYDQSGVHREPKIIDIAGGTEFFAKSKSPSTKSAGALTKSP
jgi:hypothetical protein